MITPFTWTVLTVWLFMVIVSMIACLVSLAESAELLGWAILALLLAFTTLSTINMLASMAGVI